MMHFGALSHSVAGFIGCWIFILFLGEIFLLVFGFSKSRIKNPIRSVARNVSLLLCSVLTYGMLQCITGANNKMVTVPFAVYHVELFKKLPVGVVIALCIVLSAGEIFLIHRDITWNRTHITAVSLKEAIDFLPAGVCAYEESGRVVLKNAAMERISNEISGEELLSGLDFEQRVKDFPVRDKMGRKEVLILPDKSVFIFSKEKITPGGNLTLLTAYDMTEEYNKTRVLLEKRKSVSQLNSQLIEYNRDIVSIITTQEILNAKVKIHDEFGAHLLAIRHYLINGGGKEEKEEIIDKLKQNIKFLQSETAESRQDEYILMFSTANALDVRILIDGKLPEEEPNKHIVATAIHECFTNTVRHAKGDLLHISVLQSADEDRIEVIFTNNGEQPDGEITEGGGLTSLRKMTEAAGGYMQISVLGGFNLKLSLLKGGRADGI